ncbi:glycoside hydrolase family 32 protein [Actinoplanes derwentensis]|uniref:beta-fructofuranosidase n=1 Tax=Actinoplanes derwentensis TaxID=113562 RepID=A0A1H1R7S8_9ACTN|nr:glycoside hydrolase family 32 protein [Actinoplanes derwentensis]GID88020.1 beta-fructosidase [Actinoplanes derwentensis]SDS30939.1 beta-fructofuranosidase [Actinoplanes derwentensis]
MELAPRPRLHFTPRTGRVGDLFGVLAVDGRHHVFYELDIAGEGTAWGWAISDDLVIWTEQGVVPAPGDARCGTVVAGPVIFYTRGDGQITRAVPEPGFAGWRQDVPGPLITTPPSGVTDMCDPAVWWAGSGWRMLLSGRLRDGSAAVLQYHSADLLNWSYDGVLIAKEQATWGCPRLFPLDGSWVLMVTTGDEVAYGIGDYDGLHFTARTWGTFGRGSLGPAVTFVDAAGRRCLLARLGDDLAWSGALSLPWVLSVRDERLIVTPHPNLDPYLISGATGLTAAGGEVRDHGDLILRMPTGGETTLFTDADIVEVTVEGVSGLGVARRTSPAAPGVRFARFGGLS